LSGGNQILLPTPIRCSRYSYGTHY
jgi:hypothetical protein